MILQYNLFEATKQAVIEPEHPWQGTFPDWMPQVGGLAQMHSVILEEQGYCYGDCVRINSIEGENVTCTVEHQIDAEWWKNGTVYTCTLNDLWPNMYHNNKYNSLNLL
jgi:hypothetical protein